MLQKHVETQLTLTLNSNRRWTGPNVTVESFSPLNPEMSFLAGKEVRVLYLKTLWFITLI